jgi:hypothetical protein
MNKKNRADHNNDLNNTVKNNKNLTPTTKQHGRPAGGALWGGV